MRAAYADDARLSARKALRSARTGPQPQDIALNESLPDLPDSLTVTAAGSVFIATTPA